MTISTDVLPVVIPVQNLPGGPIPGEWTYAEYAGLTRENEIFEIIDGVLYMPPAPNIAHQGANRWFLFYLTQYVQLPGLGQVFGPPCDVELAPKDVVQPDVLVILQPNSAIIKTDRIMGAPDLIVEISSPGTAGYDRREKQNTYAKYGVKEYWIADPGNRTIEILVLDSENKSYNSSGVFLGQATLPSGIIPAMPVKVEQFFA